MGHILNEHGKPIDFDAALVLMDDSLVKELEDKHGSEQDFFNAYCVLHQTRYGSEFEPNKPNPVW